MKKEYTIIEENTLFALKSEVNEYLEYGWKCVGGLAFHDTRFYQALERDNWVNE